MYFELYVLCTIFLYSVNSEKCLTPNNETAECISLFNCPKLLEALGTKQERSLEFYQKSTCGGSVSNPMVCCGSSVNYTLQVERKSRTKDPLLPRSICGLQHADDYFHTVNHTVITEFPWLVVIQAKETIERSKNRPYGRGYYCVGSLINQRYVLTAAWCLTLSYFTPTSVRIGDYHINNVTDCLLDSQLTECTADAETVGIEKTIIHPQYLSSFGEDDIGLIRMNKKVVYTDYIRPICLPFSDIKRAQTGDTLITNGWGFLRIDEYNDIKTKAVSTLIPWKKCASLGRDEKNICVQAIENSTSDVCSYGNVGAPVVFSNRFKWHQEGIVRQTSYCDKSNNLLIYTNVSYYLKWIEDNLEP